MIRASVVVLLWALSAPGKPLDKQLEEIDALEGEVESHSAGTCADGQDCCQSADCKTLRQKLIAILAERRDRAWAGDKVCLSWLKGLDLRRLRERISEDGEVTRFTESLAKGPPGKLSEASRVVALWIREPGHDAKPYIGRKTPILIEERFYSSGSDDPTLSTRRKMTVVGNAGVDKWTEKLVDGAPGPGEVLWCDRACCHWPFVERDPHHFQLTDLCFDGQLHLTKVRTELSGM